MAIKKVIEIDVEQVKAMGGLDALQDSLKATEEKSVSLKAELRKLKEQLAQLPEGSAEYDKIAKKAGEVSDKLGDINTRIKNLGSDTKNIDAVVEGAQALSGAFTIATSASALLGSENKELQETMLKVESAIGLTVGIQSVANALQKETALSIGLNTIATKIQIGAQLAYTAVVGGTTGALKALRIALVSTGVGAIVVVLGLLVAKLMESADAVEENTEKLDDYKKSLDSSTESINSFNDALERQSKADILRAKIAGKNEKEILEIKVKSLQTQKKNIDEQIKADQTLIKSQSLGYEKTIALIDRQDKLRKQSSDLRFEIENQGLEFELELADKRREVIKKREEEEKRKAKEKLEELIRQRKDELEKINRFAKEVEDATIKAEKEKAEKVKEVQDFLKNAIAEEETPAQKLKREYDERFKILQDANLSTLQLTAQYNTDLFELQEEANFARIQQLRDLAQEEINLDIAIKQAKRDALQTSLDILNQFAGKNKSIALGILAIQKGLAIADIVVNASKSLALGQANLASIPIVLPPGIPNPAYPIAVANTAKNAVLTKLTAGTSIASILASGLNQAQNITNPQSGGGGASGGGGGTSATPQFNIVGQNSNNQLAQSISQQQRQPVEAYVVAGNITTAQSLDRNKIDTATFN